MRAGAMPLVWGGVAALGVGVALVVVGVVVHLFSSPKKAQAQHFVMPLHTAWGQILLEEYR